jgi:CBS domain-containing protein
MRVQDIMSEAVKSCRPETNLAEAASIMWEGDCGILPVISDGGKVIGLITDRDLAMAAGTTNRIPSDINVGEAMSRDIYDCTPDDDIHAALETMRKGKVRRLPVVNDDGVIEGVLSLNDIARHAEKLEGRGTTTELSYDDVVITLKAISEHRRLAVAMEAQVATPR